MKKTLSILACAAALTLAGVRAPAQEVSRPADPAATVERVRSDAGDARRRESDLAAQVAEQERANATLRDQIRRAGNDPSGLGKDLADASAQAETLRKKVAEQRQRRDAAEDKYAAQRDRAMGKFEQTEPVRSAAKAVSDAAAELDRLSQPIFEQLTQTPAYQEQQAIVDAASQTGEALQAFGVPDSRAQAEADAAFDQAIGGLRELEDAAISTDPKAAEARKSLKVAQDSLDGLRRQNESKIAGDPGVDAARFALDLEQKLMDDASAELATAEKRLSALRQTVDAKGDAGELARQLKDGEDRLRDLNDRLDQARIARQDTEERLRMQEDALARGPSGTAEPGEPGPVPPPVYEPAYPDTGYYDGGYYGGGYYPPTYGYGYAYPRYGPYYAYDPYYYCPPYWGSGLFLGFSYGYSHYHHRYYRPYYHGYHGYPYYGSGYAYYRHRDNHFRDGYPTKVRPLPGDSRYATSNRRYDYARFDRTETRRDRDVRASIDAARRATADAERDYRYRTGGGGAGSVRTYNYPGSSRSPQREPQVSSSAVRAYQQELRDLQARRERVTGAPDSRYGTVRDAAPSNGPRTDRVDTDSGAARRARAAAEAERTRTEVRPRNGGSGGSSSVEPRGTRVTEPPRRSPSSIDNEPRRTRSSAEETGPRTRAADDSAARRARVAEESSRQRSSDDSARRARAAEETSRARGSSDSTRSGRSERAVPTPPPSIGSGRSSRGSSPAPTPAPDRGSPRGGGGDSGIRGGGSSFRGSAPAPSPAPDRGSSRGGGDSGVRGGGGGSVRDSGGSSSAGRGSSGGGGSVRGGGSSSDGGGRRGR